MCPGSPPFPELVFQPPPVCTESHAWVKVSATPCVSDLSAVLALGTLSRGPRAPRPAGRCMEGRESARLEVGGLTARGPDLQGLGFVL